AGAAAADEVLHVVGLRGVKLLGDADREEDAAAAESADAGGRIGLDDTDDAEFFLAGDDGDAAGHHGVELGVDIFFFGDFVRGERAALGVAQSDFFADQGGWLWREVLGEILLEDGFFGGGGRKIFSGDAVEGAGGAGGFGDAEYVG